MTGISHRPALFSHMGDAFTDALSNVDVVPVVDGESLPAVRGIFRQLRETDLLEVGGVSIEGVTHSLALPAALGAAIESQRDSVIMQGVEYPVLSKFDDGRAMIVLGLEGDV